MRSKSKTELQPLPAPDGFFFCDGHLEYLPIEKQSENKRFCQDCLKVITESKTWASETGKE